MRENGLVYDSGRPNEPLTPESMRRAWEMLKDIKIYDHYCGLPYGEWVSKLVGLEEFLALEADDAGE